MVTTQWSQVLAARDGSESQARAALEGLCRTYWEPLYAYVRRQGKTPDESSDLTQAYFAELLEKDFLAQVDPSKGRFRSFLLASMKHFVSHQRDRERALKRGGGSQIVSIDLDGAEERYELQSAEEWDPEEVFEYRWAVTMLNRALERLRQDSVDSGRGQRFEILRQYLPGAMDQAPYPEAARQLGMSEGALKMAVSRLRSRLGDYLRAEVAETVCDPAEIDDEVRQIVVALRGRAKEM